MISSSSATSTSNPYLASRRHSRGSSLSSSSFATVRSPNSPALEPPAVPLLRPSTAPYDPEPSQEGLNPVSKNPSKQSSPNSKRRSTIAYVQEDRSSFQETTETKSPTKQNRRKSLSKRISTGAANAIAAFHGSTSQLPSPRRSSSHVVRSPGTYADRRNRPRSPVPALPQPNPIHTLPTLQPTLYGSNPLNPSSRPSTAERLTSPPLPSPTKPKRPSHTRPPLSSERYHALGQPPPVPTISTEVSSSARAESGNQVAPTSPQRREKREKDKKAMLSRALQKANTAVVLDNAQNFEGAIEAYTDACHLLKQVMLRTSGDDDRRKLDAIRVTYTNRIEELQILDPGFQEVEDKSLPERPLSNVTVDLESQPRPIHFDDPTDDDDEPAVIETATITRIINDPSVESDRETAQSKKSSLKAWGGETPDVDSVIREVENSLSKPTADDDYLESPIDRLRPNGSITERLTSLDAPMDRNYMPTPLSPRYPPSPGKQGDQGFQNRQTPEQHLKPPQGQTPPAHNHSRTNSNGTMTWLNTIDESGSSSCASSPRSNQRRRVRSGTGDTEDEFDAALDAAVEAAYNDGLEPVKNRVAGDRSSLAMAMKHVEAAKEKVHEAEREQAIAAAKKRSRELFLEQESLPHVRNSGDLDYDDDDADEEERMLDEMTKEFMLEGFDFGLQSKSSLPRQSDSSVFSGSTWHSSIASSRGTPGTSLGTVAENSDPLQRMSMSFSKSAPSTLPPSGPLPPLEESNSPRPSTDASPAPVLENNAEVAAAPSAGYGNGVRSRRLSAQNKKQLKIETFAKQPLDDRSNKNETGTFLDSGNSDLSAPKTTTTDLDSRLASQLDGAGEPPASSRSLQVTLPPIASSPGSETVVTVSPATPGLQQIMSHDSSNPPHSPAHLKLAGRVPLRKNQSSLSLKTRNMSISSPDADGSEESTGTPMSATFSTLSGSRKGYLNTPQMAPTPNAPTFPLNGSSTSGVNLFESDIHSPHSPGSPNPLAQNAPIPLEPCPDASLLRPYWLMRCLYQTMAHPRGGYVSTKLFIPRDVWRVKGVKVKAIEEKISNCDLLSAALMKLANVDTLDADAVLEEMQALEPVLDQVQVNLTKKLGNDVGVQGIASFFKDAPTATMDGIPEKDKPTASKSSSMPTRTYLTSWRKLRSKSSSAGLNTVGPSFSVPRDQKAGPSMASVPMTSLPNIRFAKRVISQVDFSGPNSHYMGSLARLFDAVQIIDQIARQVEDPGLKHSSPTHVGLELSTRHASEFFGFYICRFVLADLTLMLDKFIKRGSEWVLL
ncbi:hypothetical protein K402DRAFT_411334 [Aulographum hederae CBS 113979]|uniref:MIT domain-containing protein n=1 Tax=Aulographum hederae CBS 113979 TaxID=1176131 RepID=A0A6G1H6X3_9PEZI|nr:hypothetical protein K402DRAFT_411334 [Aulographum hederae CBS 113979]